MKNSAALKQKLQIYLAKYRFFSEELRHLAARIFCKRKIIVISEKGISSIPVSSKSQGLLVMVAMLILLWISYSTGKYVTYENVISQKDREIWNTNVTNESLQYQMADLHQNLADLNKYFENIKQLDQISRRNVLKNEEDSVELSSLGQKDKDAKGKSGDNVQEILYNIREKVIERISSLENIIEMTGIKLDKIALNNSAFRTAMVSSGHLRSESSGDGTHQGGPYDPISDSLSVFNQEDFESEINYLLQLEKTINSFPLTAPMKEFSFSSGFGRRIDPIRRTLAMHAGLDLVGAYKSKIYTSAPGVVSYAEPYGAYGRLVEIDHGSGIKTRYGHLDRILVKEGETVKRGQLIGLQGNSGRSTGTHLHYEVRLNGKPLNPANFLEAGKYVF